MQMHDLFHEMASHEASDLHIASGAPPMIRVHGAVTPLPYEPLDANATKQLCYSVLSEQQKKKFREEMDKRDRWEVHNLKEHAHKKIRQV